MALTILDPTAEREAGRAAAGARAASAQARRAARHPQAARRRLPRRARGAAARARPDRAARGQADVHQARAADLRREIADPLRRGDRSARRLRLLRVLRSAGRAGARERSARPAVLVASQAFVDAAAAPGGAARAAGARARVRRRTRSRTAPTTRCARWRARRVAELLPRCSSQQQRGTAAVEATAGREYGRRHGRGEVAPGRAHLSDDVQRSCSSGRARVVAEVAATGAVKAEREEYFPVEIVPAFRDAGSGRRDDPGRARRARLGPAHPPARDRGGLEDLAGARLVPGRARRPGGRRADAATAPTSRRSAG